jgi:hypothetical protein
MFSSKHEKCPQTDLLATHQVVEKIAEDIKAAREGKEKQDSDRQIVKIREPQPTVR